MIVASHVFVVAMISLLEPQSHAGPSNTVTNMINTFDFSRLKFNLHNMHGKYGTPLASDNAVTVALG